MKTVNLAVLSFVAVLVAVVASASVATTNEARSSFSASYAFDCDQQFALFVAKFERTYASDRLRANARDVFCRKHAAALRLNSAAVDSDTTSDPGNRAKFSAFTKLGDVELVGNKQGFQHNSHMGTPVKNAFSDANGSTEEAIPTTRDWRKEGAVTPVWDQGQCGSTWAFPLTDNIAALWYLQKKGPLTQLSVQEIVSCSTSNDGCQGGMPDSALNDIMTILKGEILTNESFPYASGEGQVPPCRTTGTIGATIKGWGYIQNNEDLYAQYVGNIAPLAVDIDAESLQTYEGGILTGSGCSFNNVDHCITLVGYDFTANPPYWIARNTWGTDWGEGGYFRMAKGVNCLDVTFYNATVAFL